MTSPSAMTISFPLNEIFDSSKTSWLMINSILSELSSKVANTIAPRLV